MTKILIVDELEAYRDFAKETLSKLYSVTVSPEFVSSDYDLILVDSDLVPSKCQGNVVVLLTSSGRTKDIQATRNAFKSGVRDCVEKPYSKEGLIKLVERFL